MDGKALAERTLARIEEVRARATRAATSLRHGEAVSPEAVRQVCDKPAPKPVSEAVPPRPDGSCPGCGGQPSPGSRLLLCSCGWTAPEVAALASPAGGAATVADRLFVRTLPQRLQVCRRYLLFLLEAGPVDGREAVAGWPAAAEDVLRVEAEVGTRVALAGGLAEGAPVVYLPEQEPEVRRMQRASARLAPEVRRELRERTRRRVAAWWGE